MAQLIGYPTGKVLAVFDTEAAADAALAALRTAGFADDRIERFAGVADADRFDATGARHGVVARTRRAVQFSLMDQLPAMAWYEAGLREGKTVLAVVASDRRATLRAVSTLKAAGAHFINRFGRLETEEFARWHGPEASVSSLMKH
jgi:hypothetical protein